LDRPVENPAELLAAIREHWDAASAELAHGATAALQRFLAGFPGTEAAIEMLGSNLSPGAKLVYLQSLLGPAGEIAHGRLLLSVPAIRGIVQAARNADPAAIQWLDNSVQQGILVAWAQAVGDDSAAESAAQLERWRDQVADVVLQLPPQHRSDAWEAFRNALPKLFAVAFHEPDPAFVQETSRWLPEVRRLAGTGANGPIWLARVIELLDSTTDADLGILIATRAVLNRTALEAADNRALAAAKLAAAVENEALLSAATVAVADAEKRKTKLERQHLIDGLTIVIFLAITITGVVPWVIGRFGLRDSFLLPTGTGAPPALWGIVRDDMNYLAADYFAGATIVLLAAGLVTVLRPWRARVAPVVVGFCAIALAFGTHWLAYSIWEDREAEIDTKPIYPYEEVVSRSEGNERACSLSYGINKDGTIVDYLLIGGQNYYVWVGGEEIDLGPGGSQLICEKATAYRDWTEISSVNLVDTAPTGSSVCNTNGRASGIIWSSDGTATVDGLSVDGVWWYYINDGDSAELTFTEREEFKELFPNC
jgi:hypothetical protein